MLAYLTRHLKYNSDNLVRVTVNNNAAPNSRWYSGSGIYRHVWLMIADKIHIAPWGIYATTPEVSDQSSEMNLPFDSKNEAEQTLEVSPANLWSVGNPYLYTLRSEIVRNGEVIDSAETMIGIRSISFDTKNGFRLNGITTKLKGGCVHHDCSLIGAASYDRAEERKVELMKANGYNAVRCAHNPPVPAFLNACDRLGLLVVDEAFDCWLEGKQPNDYSNYFEDWWERDLAAMVIRDRNHPSIIMWSTGNEIIERGGHSDGYAYSRRNRTCKYCYKSTIIRPFCEHFYYKKIPLDT